MREVSTFELRDFERVVEEISGKFTIADLMKKIGCNRSKTNRARIERLLEGYEDFFSDGEGEYLRRADYFNGKTFLITPDDWEISQGFVIPGHRFVPFVSPEVFASEVTLRLSSGDAIAKHEISLPLGKAVDYHILLGSEQILDYFIAESPANIGLQKSARSSDLVTLGVYDFAELFRAWDFQVGDALECVVLDYENGVIEVKYLEGTRRSSREMLDFVATLENGLKKTIDRFAEDLEIPDQLAWTFYYVGKNGDLTPRASLDEFIAESDLTSINTESNHAVLTLKGVSDEVEDDDDDDGCDCGHDHCDHDHHHHGADSPFSISSGETSDFGEMLKQVGVTLSPTEVESIAMDQCGCGDLNFDNFYARIFSHGAPKFTDDAQEAILLNFLEDLLETTSENYNRIGDEPKLALRGRILDLIEKRREVLSYLRDSEVKITDSTRAKLQRLAAINARFDEVLDTLNHSLLDPENGVLEKIEELIDRREDEQEELINSIYDNMEGQEK